MRHFLDFERPIAELEGKIEELRHLSADSGLNIAEEVGRLEAQADRLLRQTYARLTPWQKVQVARHPERPHCLDYIAGLISEFVPLAGDRAFAEDSAIVGGIGRFRGRSVMVLGTEKGADTEARVEHNFGMARPEGYRKARRLMRLAERFALPVLTFVDTAGAYPGVDAEARGQSEAIARAIEACPRSADAGDRRDHRRGRLGRRDRARRRQCRADAGARDLFGDLARGLRLDLVARCRTCSGSRRGAAADRAGYAAARCHRPHRGGAAGRRPPVAARKRSPRSARQSPRACPRCSRATATICATSGGENSLRSAASRCEPAAVARCPAH